MDKLRESHEAYLRQRAQDKYDGKVDGLFPLEAFRLSADYLAGVIGNAAFDEEDLADIVRVALLSRGKIAASNDEARSAAVVGRQGD
jgi:hypothetical protein